MIAAVVVGIKAARSRRPLLRTSFGNFDFKKLNPIGLGAFAMIVAPPPTNAPATKAHLTASLKPESFEPKNVSAALSDTDVNATAEKKIAISPTSFMSGSNHQL